MAPESAVLCDFIFPLAPIARLIRVDDAKQMAYVNSNLAREIGRLVDWRGPFWERRYQAIVISAETVAQVDRLRYILENGVKEGLIASPLDWPGIHMARASKTSP